ncbi:MAG: tetratricopeptide repeat protein [bacterium]
MDLYYILYQTINNYIKNRNSIFFSFDNLYSANILINILKKNISDIKVVSLKELFEDFLSYSYTLESNQDIINQIENFVIKKYSNLSLVLLIEFQEFVDNIDQLDIFLRNIINYANKGNLFFIFDNRILNLIKLQSEFINLDKLEINLFFELISKVLLLRYNLRESFSSSFLIKLLKYCNNSILDIFVIYQIVYKIINKNLNPKISFNKTFIKEVLYQLEENFNINKEYINLITKDNYLKIFSFVLNNLEILGKEEDIAFLYDFNTQEKIFYKYYILEKYFYDFENNFGRFLINKLINNNFTNIDKSLEIVNLIIDSFKILRKNSFFNPLLYFEQNGLESIFKLIFSFSDLSYKELINLMVYLRQNLLDENKNDNNNKNEELENSLNLLFNLLSIFLDNKFLFLKLKENQDSYFVVFYVKETNFNVINLKETISNRLKTLKNVILEEVILVNLKDKQRLVDFFIDFIISTIKTSYNTLNINVMKIIEIIFNSTLLANNIEFLNNKAFYYIVINDINLANIYLNYFFKFISDLKINYDSNIAVYNLAYINYVKGDYKEALKILEENSKNLKNESKYSVIKTILPIPFKDIVKSIKDNTLSPNLEYFFNIEFDVPIYVLFLLSIANIYYILNQKEKTLEMIQKINDLDYQFELTKLDDIKFYEKSIAIIYKDKSKLPKDNTFELFTKLI